MSKSFVLRNFLFDHDVKQLNQWTLDNCHRKIFEDACMDPDNPGTRFTTRFPNESVAPDINYPKSAFAVKQRIVDYFHLRRYKNPPSYSHGIVNGIGYAGGRIENHIDPTYYPNTKTVHFNAITQQASRGGHTVIGGVEYNDLNPTDLLIYQVSEIHHEVTPTEGNIPRILWVFGFCLDDIKIKELFL
ncbi:2OG-Fe(II) oxygenase superfamily protein [Synechococcus phage S-SCSM1]|uniref:2OG-Fe(II) oxygenase superfamily protein n=1 Tax=Synechococcus phage S-SCSM1 TaxID=2588487 RepID=A0A6M2ZJB2_9CAUD|nr:2OG-Fe(II) oxygenase superfamily protein [Synechococcus phage S-SCSM1]QFG06505.1 2OG-Fe(II) oxygenase superfamily protein [Synechococcus phage S-SCSM1]